MTAHDRRRDAPKQIAWPVREEYVKSPSRASLVDVGELVVGTVVMSVAFVALALALIVASGL